MGEALALAQSVRRTAIEHGGYRIRVVTRGHPAGPHAVLLPGMAATAHSLAPQLRVLRCLGYTTHVVELPGFGLGPALRKADARFPQLADDVIAAVDALGIERALFLGHSLGGGIALHVALKRPALVDRLVLLAPAALGRSLVWTYKLFCMPLIGRALMRPYKRGSRAYLKHFLLGSARSEDHHFVDMLLRQDTHSADKARSMRAIIWANQPRLWKRLLLLLVPGGEQLAFTLRERLADVAHIPTLVLWGSEDRVISAGDGPACRAKYPRAEIHVARGVGHMLPLEAPGWVNRHILRFAARRRDERSGRAS